jgi:hypothetical protein
MRRTKRHVALALVAGLAMFGCADGYDDEAEIDEAEAEVGPEAEMAEAEYGFVEWDADQNRYLDENEWTTWDADRDRSAWNTDGEDGLSAEEFGATTVTLWDRDDDGLVSEDEWTEGTDRWFGDDVDYGVWADWDMDGDSELDANEVREGFETNNLYDRVDGDADAIIDDEELADWFFDVFDLNDDAQIDTTEWDWGEERGYTG